MPKINTAMDYELHDMMEFRSIFINYQFIKTIKIIEKMKVFQGFDIKTNEDVLIKIIKLENVGQFNCLNNRTSFDSVCDLYKILSILNVKSLPKVLINKKIQNYQVIVQTAANGMFLERYIETSTDINCTDALKIIAQLLVLLNYLSTMKIRVSEFSIKSIVMDEGNNVKIYEIDWMYFDDSIDSQYENRHVRNLLKILRYILMKSDKNATQANAHITNIKMAQSKNHGRKSSRLSKQAELDAYRKIQLLQTMMYNSTDILTFSHLNNILNISESPVFRNLFILDSLVVSEIHKLGFSDFDGTLANSAASKHFYLYRLVEDNVVRSEIRGHCKTFHHLMDHLNKAISEKGILNINRMEDSIFRVLSEQEEEKFTLIRNRMLVLYEGLSYYSSFYKCMSCAGSNDLAFIEIPIFNYERWFDILKTLKMAKIPAWRNDDKIKIRDESVGLSIVVKLKKKTYNSAF
ncbi:uncharacterized protein VICG_01092 [Vittaforma corneae ATCC 50505]|uniref:Protein kinase domain-containing protein n=1 Tax=Vittaforma corneae (strain ATCC 50505) TaxID=993615 RepID=L2GLZ0_VITCO|nr:uncharacterized protein VICG_01092 [Vittaforma corneae ATCC 50505]ELA41908.1 hypothetical protein VICG_01092 [Vittaforma corneae ATCC 50505]